MSSEPVSRREPEAPPQIELPAYTYVPGLTPHPHRRDHPPTSGASPPPCSVSPTSSEQTRDAHFNWGWTLFHLGYYWEAHEAWEELWLAWGRSGPQAEFVKGLIKLAACGVKCLEGNETGAKRHARRAWELLHNVAVPGGDSADVTHGLDLRDLILLAERLTAAPPLLPPSRRDEPGRGGVPILAERIGPMVGKTRSTSVFPERRGSDP